MEKTVENVYDLSLRKFFNGLKVLYSRERESYQERLSKFFEPLLFKYKVAKEIEKQTNRFLASDFNLVDIMSPDENKVSDIIALLLKPDGEHGQGKVFLVKFLKMLEKFVDKKFLDELDVSQVSVIREYTTNIKRRIDIFLNFSDEFFIGIENKSWAGEQENQLEDYSKYLEEISGGNYFLIYLDAQGREATSIKKDLKKELKKEGKFLEISYHRFLIPWLKECFKECEAEKVRWFLRDFITWIEKSFREEIEDAQ